MVAPESKARLNKELKRGFTWCGGQGSVCYVITFHTEDKAMLVEGEDPHAASDGVEFEPFRLQI